MQDWIRSLCAACDAWAERTGSPVSLVVGPLLDYTGGEQAGFTDRSTDSLDAWFRRLIRETGMHEHFLVFAAIKATEAAHAEYLGRVDAEHARARERFPNGKLANTDIEEDRNRRRLGLDVWCELALPILRGSVFDPS